MELINSSKLEVNNQKTDEILKGLKEKGIDVSVENLAQYIRKQGVIVKVHVGRIRNFVEITPKIFGVDLSQKNSEVNEFFKQHMKMGKLKFIPDSYEKKLESHESAVRMQKKRLSMGYDDSFMTIDTYKDFMDYFEGYKVKYLEQRNEILLNWDSIIFSFKSNLRNTLNELEAVEIEKLYNSILSKIPSKSEYEESFYMSLTVKAFPVMENISMFDESIQGQIKESLKEDTLNTVYEMVGNVLNDAFQSVNSLLVSISKNEKVANRTIGGIKNAIDKIGKKNLFHNEKVEIIRTDMLKMVEITDVDDISEYAENLLAKIYGYSYELGLASHLDTRDSVLSVSDLKEIYAFV